MKLKNTFSAFLFLSASFLLNAQKQPVIQIKLDTNQEAQTIYGFGASDAWGCQFLGKNWPTEKKEKVADWLFSMDTLNNGQPKGIGLSIWRFNIGGGTTEQGDSSLINDEWRRAECFLNADGSYNWQKQQGQQWFLNAARKRGVNHFIAFSNTPPVYFTKNGKGYSGGGSSVNLNPEYFSKYADFLIKVLQHFNSQQINFDIISPFNEPQWGWDGKGQEGTPCKNTEMFQLVKELNSKISNSNLKTKIEITEAGQYNYLYNDSTNLNDRDNQIYEFFCPKSALYLGNLPNVSNSIAGHSYFTTFDVNNMKSHRISLLSKIRDVNKNIAFNMTEYCLLEDNKEIKGEGRDLGIDPALYIAKVIHYDLTLANASSWQWWLSISPYDYKDGLIYTDLNKNDGNIYDSKMLWALGHYSRFIRPGMKRIKAEALNIKTLENGNEELLVSAFKGTSKNRLVAVIVNLSDSEKETSLEIKNNTYKILKAYKTTSNPQENIVSLGTFKPSENIVIPAKSIVTVELN